MKQLQQFYVRTSILLFVIFFLCHIVSVIAQNQDSIKNKKITFGINYNQIPYMFKGMNRYFVTTDYTEKWHSHAINQSIQENLSATALQNNSFEENFLYLRNTGRKLDYKIDQASDKELFYGVWRAKLITIKNESELKELMNYGTDFLISKGYSITEILPFISLLLQEHHDYHYDNDRTKIFKESATGVYSYVDILQAFNYYNVGEAKNIGVCRDVHEVGLRMMREICTTYYNTVYPGNKINIDDYLFLVSWATQSSQHVTISFTDPLNTSKTYELDWGRFIEKTDNVGYEHGRNYGNAYRVWKFDAKKNIVRPIDSKKTNVGNFLDDQLYTNEEFETFAGIKNIEPYSAAHFQKVFNPRIKLQTSFGSLSQNQKFIQYTLSYRSAEKKLGKYFTYNGVASFQNMLMEEHEKKNLMFPINNYSMSAVLYFFPRYIANFKTKKIKLAKHVSSHFYSSNSVEIFMYLDDYRLSDTDVNIKYSKSADGSILLTQGYQIDYSSINAKFKAKLKLQNRGFLIPKEIRLMSPNPKELLSNARLVSPAQDLMVALDYSVNQQLTLASNHILEYTNQKNIITYQQIDVTALLKKVGYVGLSASICQNVKGMQYFWYPINRRKLEISYSNLKQSLRAGVNVQLFDKNDVVFGAGLLVGLR